jgi:hypothetical protein
MASTRTQEATGPGGRANGHVPRTRDLVVASAPPKANRRDLFVGVVIIVVFALAGVLWHLTSLDKAPALAMTTGVARGETIETSDVRVVYLTTDSRVARLDPSQIDRIVGHRAVADLPSGALLTEAAVADTAVLGPDDGLVGLSLEPGQYPALDLAPGDMVNVVVSPNGTTEPASEPVLGQAEVLAVRDLAGGERKLVSLKASEPAANAIAAVDPAALRLVTVSP